MAPKRRITPVANGFAYDYLGSDDKQQILRNKLANLEAQHWDYKCTRLVVESLPLSAERDEQLAKLDLAIASAEHAHAVIKALVDA